MRCATLFPQAPKGDVDLAAAFLHRLGLLFVLFVETVIPPNASRNKAIDCDMEKYRRRHRVENFFCRIKYFHHIATRYDQTESSYAAMIFVIAALLALA